MVNEAVKKKQSIINLLKKSGAAVSGEEIAITLGVSRVAVWKIISGLRDSGYKIESTHSGYRLISSTDKPLPWEMGEISSRIEYHEVLDSTMNKASMLIDSGCENGTVIIAGSQTAGISSDGRRWSSPDGGLYFTRIRTRPFPSIYCGLYPVAIAAAVVIVMREVYDIEAFIDWPGGITVEGKKLGGILTEFRGKNNTVTAATAGIGLNLDSSNTLPDGAGAMAHFTDKTISAKKITAELLEAIESRQSPFWSNESIKEYENLIIQLDGDITKLHCSGNLLLTTKDGRIEYIFSGDNIKYE